MDAEIKLIPVNAVNKLAINEVLGCNAATARYGLALSSEEARKLVETRADALSRNGRVEFAGGIIRKMIIKFCESPFLSQHNYAETMNELIETFYYFKNETLDEISDDELISLMKRYFDQSCQGSVELLQTRDLEALARGVRYGTGDYACRLEEAEEL